MTGAVKWKKSFPGKLLKYSTHHLRVDGVGVNKVTDIQAFLFSTHLTDS
jgi:hypothetical protein